MVRERIEELRRQLELHNFKYYVENAPEISDFEFDAMMRELQDLERAHPEYADPNSPSVRVGSDLTVKHRYAMLSLGNTYSLDELHEFIGRIEREAGATEMHLHAQCRATPFYERRGYEQYGPVELDEHVEHIWMRKAL